MQYLKTQKNNISRVNVKGFVIFIGGDGRGLLPGKELSISQVDLKMTDNEYNLFCHSQ